MQLADEAGGSVDLIPIYAGHDHDDRPVLASQTVFRLAARGH